MELRDVARLAWKRRWAVLLVLAVCLGMSAVFLSVTTKKYESKATLALTPTTRGQDINITPDTLSALLGTYAETAKSRLLRQRAAARLGRPLNAKISTDTVTGTGILRIIARSSDPRTAAADAAAMAAVFQDALRNPLLVSTLVDTPVVSSTPVVPKPKLTLAVAIVLGLFGGVLLAFGLENFRRRINTAADIAEFSSAPVIGRIGRARHIGRRNGSEIVWGAEEGLAAQEAFRGLRTNLQFMLSANDRVVQMTSSEQGEGKSTVSANLAIALSQIGVPTILVDADLRRPRQHEIFEIDNRYGLSSVLKGKESELPLIESGFENLSILPAGPLLTDPTESLSVRLPSVMAMLAGLPGLVLVDTPPVLPVSDARLVAPHVHGLLLVVGAGSQRPQRFQLALDRISLTGTPVLGFVLNRVPRDDESRLSGYGYGYQSAMVAQPDEAVETART